MFYGYYGNTLGGRSCGPPEPEPGANVSAPLNIAGRPVCGPQVVAPVSYNTSLGYLFTITSGLFVTCIVLVYRLSVRAVNQRCLLFSLKYLLECLENERKKRSLLRLRSFHLSISRYFGRRFFVFPSRGKLAGNVFCGWDFKVTKAMSVQRQSENISTQLKVHLWFFTTFTAATTTTTTTTAGWAASKLLV